MVNKAKLQKLINACVKAHNAVHKSERELYKFCEQNWEFDEMPDWIIDGCLGGCGVSMGLTADEFIREMDENKY